MTINKFEWFFRKWQQKIIFVCQFVNLSSICFIYLNINQFSNFFHPLSLSVMMCNQWSVNEKKIQSYANWVSSSHRQSAPEYANESLIRSFFRMEIDIELHARRGRKKKCACASEFFIIKHTDSTLMRIHKFSLLSLSLLFFLPHHLTINPFLNFCRFILDVISRISSSHHITRKLVDGVDRARII